MLARNTDPHQKCDRRNPAVNGAIALPTPEIEAQIEIARTRSRPWNTFARIDSVAGMTSAAPIPIIARQTTICVALLAGIAIADAMPKIARPSCSIPLRPNRSPSAPPANRSPAKARL